jgi:phage terminase large subunit-like protein
MPQIATTLQKMPRPRPNRKAKADWTPEEVIADPVRYLALHNDHDQQYALGGLTARHAREFVGRWHQWAHEGQDPDDSDWRIWLIMAGRGFGKTLAGAQWVHRVARADGNAQIALVGATMEDVRKVMVEGPSGILATAHDDEKVHWHLVRGELHFHSGAVAHIYSAEAHEKLRGPQHGYAWCDELGKWSNAQDCWHNLLMGLRIGSQPRALVTTTPRGVAVLRALVEEPGVMLRGGSSADNMHLPDQFLATMQALYGGTRLGRQEIGGEMLEDVEDALWTRDLIEQCRVGDMRLRAPVALKRIVIGVDPPASKTGDACGIVAVGKGADGKAYVLADHSVKGRSPEGWARAVAAAAEAWGADRVIAEVNQGGDMVESTLRAADVGMPVKKVHASRGKVARAEPVVALYQSGKAFHAGAFPELEDELCGLISGGGYEGPGRSPDRADALVWAMTELMLGKRGVEPRVRQL